MKQKLFALLCAILLVSSLVGCKKKAENPMKENFPNPWGQEAMDAGSKMGQITALDGNTITVSTMGGFGMGRGDFEDGEMPDWPDDGQMPEKGEFPGRPEGGEFPERPEGGEMPDFGEGGQMPERPEDGQMPGGETLTITVTEDTTIILSDSTSGSMTDLSTDDFIRFTVDKKNNALTIEIVDMSNQNFSKDKPQEFSNF